MPKRRRKWNETVYRKYLREGRGQGAGANYIPWLHVQDFPSNGMASRVRGTKTGRIHHLMSNLETSLFFILDWSESVLDIREQYPILDIQRIIEIAESAQIKYPYDPQSGFPYIMTSDFFIETVDGPTVVTIKTSSDLEKPRTREKLEIERRYWQSQGIKWSIATENEINSTKARNIEWLSQSRELEWFGIPKDTQESCILYFVARYECCINLGELLREVELEFNLAAGVGLNIYKHMAYWKHIEFDASKAIEFTEFTRRNAVCGIGA
jgi:hypothetical protein